MLAEVAVGDLCTEAVEAAVEAVEKNVNMVVGFFKILNFKSTQLWNFGFQDAIKKVSTYTQTKLLKCFLYFLKE